MRPFVVVYNAITVDGGITGFEADLATYYGIASEWPVDAILVGADTFLLSGEGFDRVDRIPAKKPEQKGGPLMVIPDSRGRIKNIKMLRDSEYWGDILILCSRATPRSHLEYLKKRGVEYYVAGDEHVDLAAALDYLAEKHDVKYVRVDSGGRLNGALLQAGLVDEVVALIHPQVVGSAGKGTMFVLPQAADGESAIPLKLISFKKMGHGLVLIRYSVSERIQKES